VISTRLCLLNLLIKIMSLFNQTLIKIDIYIKLIEKKEKKINIHILEILFENKFIFIFKSKIYLYKKI